MTFESNKAWQFHQNVGFRCWWQKINFTSVHETVTLAAIHFHAPPVRLVIDAALYNEGAPNSSYATFDKVAADDFSALLALAFPKQPMSACEFFDNFSPVGLAQRIIKCRRHRKLVLSTPLEFPDYLPDAWL